MGRRRSEFRPNIVLASAIYTGLSSIFRFAKKRRSRQTEKVYRSIEKIWNNARENLKTGKRTTPHDFTALQNAESNLRKQYLKTLWYSTRPYGNREFKRVYDWREGTVGPLNSLLNYAGARLRDLALTRYPFPEPDYYQIREYDDGSKRILDKKTVEANHEDVIAKSYWKAGYRGNSKHPRVLLTHPTFPGLDFVDMIRAHVIEMCRQCFIQNVPRACSHRYIRLLIHRLRPFLDWVYTQGETGRKHFYPDADGELRRLVLEIRALYGRRSGRAEPLSRQLHEELPRVGIDFLRSKAVEVLNTATDEATKDACQTILNHIELGNVVIRDVEKLMDQVISASQREGNDWH